MALIIKVLGAGVISNTTLTDIYTATQTSAVISNLRVVNYTANPALMHLYVKPAGSAYNRRIEKPAYTISAGGEYVMQDVVTVGEGDKLQIALTGTSPTASYMINGMERE
jgi:hypothetical protein